jgi:hypothetical protein
MTVKLVAPGDDIPEPEWRGANPDAPLDALVRRLSQEAEELFNETGGIEMIWLVEAPAKGQTLIMTPLVPPPGQMREAKDALAEGMRALFRKFGVTRYVDVAEMWVVRRARELGEPQGSLADDPDRREVMMFNADDGFECLVAMREIVRPQHSKPYLSKLSKIEHLNRRDAQGRFCDLLPSPTKAQKH